MMHEIEQIAPIVGRTWREACTPRRKRQRVSSEQNWLHESGFKGHGFSRAVNGA